MSNNGSNSRSESSSSSPNQSHSYFLLDSKESSVDLMLLNRSATVRRVSSASKSEIVGGEQKQQQADGSFRQSLESIHEYKPIAGVVFSRDRSVDSSSTDDVDERDKTLISQSSSYLSWIESVNCSNTNLVVQDCDNKVGEWNNFWLNYNSARSKYLSNPHINNAHDDKTDDFSEVRSTGSTQRDLTEKNSTESVTLTVEELNEAIRCSQRATEILMNALRRNEQEMEDSMHSYYSQSFTRQNSSIKEVDIMNTVHRERSFSYAVDQDLQKQKTMFKNTPQSSSTSCINALLNTGVADMLKRVITKRRDTMTPPEDTRAPFPDWSSSK